MAVSADWQVGDRAVCVDASNADWAGHNGGLVEGGVYTVREVFLSGFGNLGFRLYELRDPTDALDRGFRAERFRKVVADEHEACEPEFVTLLKRRKVPLTRETAEQIRRWRQEDADNGIVWEDSPGSGRVVNTLPVNE